MDYEQKRVEALARLGRDGLGRLLETEAGFRFKGSLSARNVSCCIGADDQHPSGSVDLDRGLVNDFRPHHGGNTVEHYLGRGDGRIGAQTLFRAAGMPLKGGPRVQQALDRVDFDHLVTAAPIEADLASRADALFNRLIHDCVEHLTTAAATEPLVAYLTTTRGISREVAAAREVGLVPPQRLVQAVADLIGIGYPTYTFESFCRGGGYAGYLIWLLRNDGRPTHLKVRGLPTPQRTQNPKNIWTYTIRPGEQGYLGRPQSGELFVFEGEFNQLQADQRAGTPINSIAVGSSSSGKALAPHLHRLSSDIVVIGDQDPAGIAMVQAIADVGEISVVYPPNGEDADEFLRHSSWESLLTLATTVKPSWEGFKAVIRPMLHQQTSESQKDRITAAVMDALSKKGRILRTTDGECLFVEE